MRIRNRRLTWLIAAILTWSLRGWCRMTRCRLVLAGPQITPYGDTGPQRFIFCLWHDAVVGGIFSHRGRNVAALVSRHTDGGLVSDAMHLLGLTTIRGSSRRHGAEALRQMIDAARDYSIAIATDGPQGPRRVVKEGIVFLASQTGKPIVPMAYGARRAWRIPGRWTDMVIPWPFTRACILSGTPIEVPSGLSREALEPYRQQVQAAMDALCVRAEEIAAGAVLAWPVAETPSTSSRAAA